MPKPLIVVAALLVAILSGAAGWFGVKAWRSAQTEAKPQSTVTPSTTPAPSSGEPTVSLTFDIRAIEESVANLYTVPECGSQFIPEAQEANGVEARVDASQMLEGDVETIEATPGFRVSGTNALAFLASEGSVVVTRDDLVVSPDWGAEFVPEYYAVEPHNTTFTQGIVSITGAGLCDVADDLSAIWDDIDWATATDEEIAAAEAKAADFKEAHNELPAGEYKIYMTSPVVVGEPAAIARMLTEEGVTGLATLQYTIAYSTLADEPAFEPYCENLEDETGNLVERQCDVPQDVLMEVLQRDVPLTYVIEGEPAEAVSEAYILTVD